MRNAAASPRELDRTVLAWYARRRRDLPWRRTRDAYRILVSEVMLQQTHVARVVGYYEDFLERFPDERALGEAPVADVLRAWSGLGYNRRALRLREAARSVVRDGWPRTAAALAALPGVGPYTAAAVAAFAFGEPVAAVDTNARRVIERLAGAHLAPAALRRRARALLPAGRAAAWNQALMELGATVCTARRPRCPSCPVVGCRSRDAMRAGGAPGGEAGGASAGEAAGGQVAAPRPRTPDRPRRARFEETDRYARGRLLAALLAGAPPPPGIDPERLARATASLERDGLAVRDGGTLRAP